MKEILTSKIIPDNMPFLCVHYLAGSACDHLYQIRFKLLLNAGVSWILHCSEKESHKDINSRFLDYLTFYDVS